MAIWIQFPNQINSLNSQGTLFIELLIFVKDCHYGIVISPVVIQLLLVTHLHAMDQMGLPSPQEFDRACLYNLLLE